MASSCCDVASGEPLTKFAPPSEFYRTLLRRVLAVVPREKWADGGIEWRNKMLVACILLVGGYVGYLLASSWTLVLCVVALYLGSTLLAFNAMHDGVHGSASKNKTVNAWASYVLELFGSAYWIWGGNHTKRHHVYTNIVGLDNDINLGGLVRVSEHQPLQKIHKIHGWVFPPLCLFLLPMTALFDLVKYRLKEVGSLKLEITPHRTMFFFGGKLFYVTYMFFIPWVAHGFFVAFAVLVAMNVTVGATIAIIFLVSHINEGLPTHQRVEKMEDEWALHQLKTTTNYAVNNRFLSWWVGGVNLHIEHHLFPKMNNVHLPKIQTVVQETCKEFGKPYNHHKTLWGAVAGHARKVHELSKS